LKPHKTAQMTTDFILFEGTISCVVVFFFFFFGQSLLHFILYNMSKLSSCLAVNYLLLLLQNFLRGKIIKLNKEMKQRRHWSYLPKRLRSVCCARLAFPPLLSAQGLCLEKSAVIKGFALYLFLFAFLFKNSVAETAAHPCSFCRLMPSKCRKK